MVIQSGGQWAFVYFASCLIAFAGFAAAFAASAVYVLQERMLKAKRVNGVQRHLPALGNADRLAYRMAAFGFLMLTVGMIAGALRSLATAGHILLEPSGAWLLITWLVYAAYLHVRGISGWRGAWTNRLLAIGFACVVAALCRVGLSINGWH